MTSNPPPKSDNLRNRLIYGFSGFFLMMGGMLGNAWTYFIVFLVISCVCLYEFYALYLIQGKRPLKMYGIFLSLSIYVLSFLISDELIPEIYYLVLYPLFSLGFIIKLYEPQEKEAFENIALTLLGVVYVTVPFASLNMIVFVDGGYNYQVILGIFFTLWIHDIGAYFIGYRYGKHQLFARISPKKSWEGSIGGGFMALVMSYLLSQYLWVFDWWQWLGISLIITVIGTHGDLVESMLKRNIQVKDSSGALPGHGGFLDRFDNLLISAPFIALFIKIF
ncbi:MAG: phosphatidate cytidylyltransferase [Microscillaceae bacterium]|nr:phosphatidate cytidylyltransferase [Microscillaceae bacterium]